MMIATAHLRRGDRFEMAPDTYVYEVARDSSREGGAPTCRVSLTGADGYSRNRTTRNPAGFAGVINVARRSCPSANVSRVHTFVAPSDLLWDVTREEVPSDDRRSGGDFALSA